MRGRESGFRNVPEMRMSDRAQSVAEAAWKEYATMRNQRDRRFEDSGHAYSGFAEALLATNVSKMAGIFGPRKTVMIERTNPEDDDQGVDLVVTLDGAAIAVDVTCAKDLSVLQKKLRQTERSAVEMNHGSHAGEQLPRAVLAMTQEQMYSFFEAYARVQAGEATLKDLQQHPLVGEMQAQLARTLTRQTDELNRRLGYVPEHLLKAQEKALELPGADTQVSNEYLLAAEAANEANLTRYSLE